MDTEAGVRKLVELIFGKKPTIAEKKAAHSSIPSSLLNEDFLEGLTNAFVSKQNFLIPGWTGYFDSHYQNMLSSHETYVYHVMTACLFENKCSQNIFDSFISVCVILSYLSDEALSKVGVDFHDLNPDIFMVFYRKSWPFQKRKDFYLFLQYLRDHRFLTSSSDSTASPSHEGEKEEKGKESVCYRAPENVSQDMLYALQVKGASLAREVLSLTSVKLPDLPSEHELVQRMVHYRKSQEVKEAEMKQVEAFLMDETSHGESSLNSDCKPDFGEHEAKIAWHESIIEAVIKHNHSKDSGKELANNQIHDETNQILKHLESKIKSLVEVLDELKED